VVMTIGVIGIGDMGAAIATSLLRNRCDLVVSDLRATEVSKFVFPGGAGSEIRWKHWPMNATSPSLSRCRRQAGHQRGW